MSRKTKDEAQKTRARILASALTLFAKKGYEHVTFTDIAARLKLTKGAVYWHFESKEALLLALIDEMCIRFRALISFDEDLTFTYVAEKMIEKAATILDDPKGKAYFLLLHEQIQWSSDSMDQIREKLMRDNRWGPWEAFRAAVANDVRDGRARADVNPDQVAHCCLSLWSGLVHASIARVLNCDLKDTLQKAFAAIWRDIQKN